MSLTLACLLYFSPALALGVLRLNQGRRWDDAWFSGLFWPLGLCGRWIEVTAQGVVGDDATR